MTTDTIITYILEYSGTHLVKTGQTKYYNDWFAQLVTGSPIKPQAVCLFRGAKYKHGVHTRFVHLYHHGKFHHCTKELREYLASDECAEHRITHEEA